MASVSAEYLYIIQPCSAVESNRNLFKFGMSTDNPMGKRFRGYENGSRVWLIVIMNNAAKAEGELLQLLRLPSPS